MATRGGVGAAPDIFRSRTSSVGNVKSKGRVGRDGGKWDGEQRERERRSRVVLLSVHGGREDFKESSSCRHTNVTCMKKF